MRAQRIFRIFVSSTFGDFQEEREALRDRVWPVLREFCRIHGSDFQAVDLRWGVGDSAGLEHETMKICLDEIAHCQRLSPRPNFLILAGDRYGWRPLPPAIPVAEFEQVLGCFSGAAKTREFLQQWYRRDDNAVPAEWVLQPRPADYADWAPIEARLLKLLRGAAKVLGVTPERRELYFLSATHLEIVRGALNTTVADAEQHVLAFFRTLEGLPEGEPLKAAGRFTDLTPEGIRDPDALIYRNELKSELRQRLSAESGHVFDYSARWTGVPPFITTDHLDDLCRDVEASLKHLIEAELGRLEELDAVDAERQAHEDFRRERGRVFVGREEPLAAIAEYLAAVAETDESLDETADEAAHKAEEDPDEGDDWAETGDAQDEDAADEDEINASGCPLLAIHGPGGSGKSALLSRAIAAARAVHPEAVLVERFIGASPASVGLRALLGGLCREIARAYGQLEGLPEGEMKELITAFAERLGYASAERPLIVFVDSLDQLVSQDGAQPFEWLPKALPPNVHLVVSILDGPVWAEFQQRQSEALAIAMPAVSAAEAEAMLDALLADAASTEPTRRLTSAQRAAILHQSEAGLQPLWLKLAVIEVKRWRSYQKPAPLAATTPKLIQQFFARLQATHGSVLVERALAYIAASRHGLTDDELLEVLWLDPQAKTEFDRRKNPDQPGVNALPPIVWSRLYFDLEPYLIERAVDGVNCYAFFHRQFGDAVQTAFLSNDQRLARHAQLAGYFGQQGWRNAKHRAQLRLRTLAELPWQQTQAGQADAVEKTLTDFDFAMAKCEAGEDDDLVEDYRRALAILSPPGRRFRIWENFFRSRRHILRRADVDWQAHKILLQLAVEHADESPVTQAAERWLEQGYCDWVWLRNPQRVKEAGIDPCTVLLEREQVEGVQLLSDGQLLSWGSEIRIWELETEQCVAVLEGHTGVIWGVQVLAGGRLLSWSEDKTLRLWDEATGTSLAVLAGHTAGIADAQVLADGQILSWTWDWDKTLRLWDGATGASLAVLEGHTAGITDAQVLADGRILSRSVEMDKTLRLWDGTTGASLAVLEGHTGWIEGVQVLADGRFLSWSDDKTLRLWDGTTGASLAVLEGHTAGINGVQVLADGRLLSWSYDHTLRLWDGTTGASLAVLAGHTDGIHGVQVLADGRLLSWSVQDMTLRLWDGTTGACLAVLEGHTDWIKGVQVLADGPILSWGDKTLRLWDGATGACLAVLEGHTAGINGVQVLADGRILSRDHTLRLWDGTTGASLAVLEGHTDGIKGVQVLADGRLLSWSYDHTLRLWNQMTEASLAVLAGHTLGYTSWKWDFQVQVLADGLLLSWAGWDDQTLRLWDQMTGASLAVLAGHTDLIEGVQVLADGRLLSWAHDKTLRLWNGTTGASLAVLEGHTGWIEGVQVLTDGRLLSWADGDKTLRLWDGTTGASLAVLEGHTDEIKCVQELADGRILSWSADHTLRLWDGTTGASLAVLTGHTHGISGVQVLADGRILSWAGTLRLWDGTTGASLAVLEGHTDEIKGVQELADGRLLSWSDDKTLRLWDGTTGVSLAVMAGHTDWIEGVQVLADKRLLSWAHDKTLRLWDLATGTFLAVLAGHTGGIGRIQILADGRILSWVWREMEDKTLRLWDGTTGVNLAVLAGHTGWIEGVQVLADGRILSWSADHTLRLWDGTTGVCLAVIIRDGYASHIHISGDFVAASGGNTASLIDLYQSIALACWQGTAAVDIHILKRDGTLAVSLTSGHVFCLKLYRGNQRIGLSELIGVA